MVQYAMVIDLDRCLGCHTCSLACKATWEVPAEGQRAWVRRLGPEQTREGLAYGFCPGMCGHCDRPACVPVCPVEKIDKGFASDTQQGQATTISVAATWKHPISGVVELDSQRCIGCGNCVQACPYGARYLKEDGNAKFTADKCSFCLEATVEGQPPTCVQSCLGEARIFGDRHDPDSLVTRYLQKGAIRLVSSAIDTGPNIYYYGNAKNLYLLRKHCRP